MAYYNTTHMTGQGLKLSWKTAKSQQDYVLLLLTKFPKQGFTRSEAAHKIEYLYDKYIDRHDVGRCLTDLLNDGKVSKSDKLYLSPHGVGKWEHKYQIIK